MSEVERFDPVQFYDMGGSGYGYMKRESDGDYVSFEDYESLRAQVKSLLIENLTMKAQIEALTASEASPTAYGHGACEPMQGGAK